eukprot:scaffold238_cov102-Skeletonema_menzelii.AAC.5
MMLPLSNNRRIIPTVLLWAACHHNDGFLQPYRLDISSHRRPLYYQQLDVSTVTHNEDGLKQSTSGAIPSLDHPFRPWPSRVVESTGDYTHETHLERTIGGKLYENNNKNILPELPVPTIQETIQRFIPSALPLCESDEERESLMRACDTFEQQAKELQLRLLQRKEEWENSSWLQKWWNQKGYLEVRDPVAVHVSYFLSVNDDPSLPSQEELDSDDGKTNPGILRGALAIIAAAKARKRVCSGKLPCDKAGNKPLCSTGYKYLFHACRGADKATNVAEQSFGFIHSTSFHLDVQWHIHSE